MNPRIVVMLAIGFAGGLALAACGTPAPTCSRTTCNGCCDQAGQCQGGITPDACGANGNTCGRCSSGTVCQLGSCFAANTGGGGTSGGGTGGGGTGGGAGGGAGGAAGGGSTGGGQGGGGTGGGSGGGGTGGGGGDVIPCNTDADCGPGRGCHPLLRSCAPTCSGSTDCPASQRTCSTINNSVAQYCQCSTDALCAAAVPGDICNGLIRQCSARCTSTGCPFGLMCNTATGQCGGGTDAGVDAGTLCDNSSQPDVCGYGNVCDGNNQCDVVEVGACSNVANHPAWSTASTGPVIYLVEDEPLDNQSACVAPATPFTVTVYAYTGASPSMFPAQKSNLPGFFYYTTSGTAIDIPLNFLTQSNYTVYANGEVMGARFTLCGAAGLTSLQAGFGFTNGNPVCATLFH